MPRPDSPLHVSLIIYDLLPPSHLASVLNALGTGVYHSSLAISLPPRPSASAPSTSRVAIAQEIAFGAHGNQGESGVFSIPKGTAPQRMPGLRWYAELKMGEVSEVDEDGVEVLRGTASAGPSSPSARDGTDGMEKDGYESVGGTSLYGTGRDGASTVELGVETLTFQGQEEEEDGPTRTERYAWLVIDEMKRDPEWWGTNYSLLGRNCNAFTDELLFRLTGRRAPAWINRAAWVATSLPCLVPQGWVDDVDVDPIEGPRVVIEPPRADRMESTRTGNGPSYQ